MLIENDFSVPATVDHAWAYLLDVEKVAGCVPGAEPTQTVDDTTWKGRITVKLGPVSLSFAGTVSIQERDDDAHRVVLVAKGQETKGKGAASATVTAWLEGAAEETVVRIRSDVTLTGTVAQVSRGLLPDVSRRLTGEFADCLRASMAAPEQDAERAPASTRPAGDATASARRPAAPTGIGGLRLALWALWRAALRAVARIFRRG
jgi:carbon monoxide dehydrogenase subunit G